MLMAGSLMIQGTASNAGKSVLVAGLCRAFANRGLRVEPFKPQNMSNNAAVTADGGEIGRAQALQAFAARVPLTVHHNPVLLKPESDTGAQVVVHGKVAGTLDADRFGSRRGELLPKVLESFHLLEQRADLVIVEGAGSPAETNLRAGDIANMGFAEAARVPVVLAGDIDRGGVIASLVGTYAVLSPADRERIAGFLINKFRGDVGLFEPGLSTITNHTGWPSFGVVPWSRDLALLPAEDAVGITGGRSANGLRVAVPMLSRIANFDDVDPLAAEPEVDLVMVPPGQPLPVADLVIIPGTKSTIADLEFFRAQGWDVDLAAHVRRGGEVIGLCGGYQMLGGRVADPDGVEGLPGAVDGLGLLDVETILEAQKVTRSVTGTHADSSQPVAGYEIHVGRTIGPDAERPYLHLEDDDGVGGLRPDGAVSANGRIAGAYVHGIFASDGFRHALLAGFGRTSTHRHGDAVDDALDAWAGQLERELDVDSLADIAQA